MHEHPEPKWRRYLRFVRPNPRADLDDELQDHIESTMEDLVAHGLTPDAARAEALRRFGDLDRVRGEVRRLDHRYAASISRVARFETLLYDLRHAVRGLRRSPGFTLVAALSIAIAIAANSTVFSVVNAVLLRPIPGTQSDRLMRLYVNHHSPFNWQDLSWFRSRATSFDHIVGERYGAIGFRASAADGTERVHMSYVTQGFFPALGVRMVAGRAFVGNDAGSGEAEPVVVISHAFWQRRFAGNPSVVGKTIRLGEHPLTIVGVAAPEFRSSVMTWAPDVFVPLFAAPVLTGRPVDAFGGSFYTTAQLKLGVGADAAAAELRSLMSQLASTDTARYEHMTVRLDHVRGVNAELRQVVTAGSVFLIGMVGLVLLIACANVANLLLGRFATRQIETGVRLAIGASRMRLVRQMLTESVLLAALGGAAGLTGAWFLTRVLGAAVPAEAGLDARYFAPDERVVLFTAGLCVLTTVLFGVMPALLSVSTNLVALLKGGNSNARLHKRGSLVAAQTAMCVLLLAVAGVFLRSLSTLQRVDPGFRPKGIVDVTVDLGLLGPNGDDQRTFASILRNASEIPGVQSATLTAVVPLTGSNMETRVLPEGMSVARRSETPSTYFHVVAPRYFEAMRIQLRRGREFMDTDRQGASRVAVINESAARFLWPTDDAVGKRLHWGGADGPLLEVVGIAPDVDYVMPGEAPKRTVYVPFAQQPRGEMTLQIRTGASLATMRRAVWDMLRETVPMLPPPPVTRMTDDMAITLLPVRVGVALLGAFGAIALVLAAAGIYGVASYSVARRTREIGIRTALGATRTRVVRMVVWESGRRAGVGALVGLVMTIGASVAMSRILYGVRALDPLVLGGVMLLMVAVAILASLAPATRAARANPVAAMRTE